MVMSNLSRIEDIVDFDELETFRQKEPSSTETRKQVWIPHDTVKVVSFCTRLQDTDLSENDEELHIGSI